LTIAMRISFVGQCADAVAFYCDTFGVKPIEILTFGESRDIIGDVPENKSHYIYQAVLDLLGSPGIRLFLNDTPILLFQDNPNVHFMQPILEIDDTDPNIIKNLYDKLMCGGKANKVLVEEPPYVLYGSMIDAYGICWHLRCKKK